MRSAISSSMAPKPSAATASPLMGGPCTSLTAVAKRDAGEQERAARSEMAMAGQTMSCSSMVVWPLR